MTSPDPPIFAKRLTASQVPPNLSFLFFSPPPRSIQLSPYTKIGLEGPNITSLFRFHFRLVSNDSTFVSFLHLGPTKKALSDRPIGQLCLSRVVPRLKREDALFCLFPPISDFTPPDPPLIKPG